MQYNPNQSFFRKLKFSFKYWSNNFQYDMKPLILFNFKFRHHHDLEYFKQAALSANGDAIHWKNNFWTTLPANYLYQHYLMFETYKGFEKSDAKDYGKS